jgi:hypothetical protein
MATATYICSPPLPDLLWRIHAATYQMGIGAKPPPIHIPSSHRDNYVTKYTDKFTAAGEAKQAGKCFSACKLIESSWLKQAMQSQC